MGISHAKAYHVMDEFEICGIVSRGKSKENLNEQLGGGYPLYDDYFAALQDAKPDAVCISTYPDTHEEYTIAALEAGCHVFLEKPIADTAAGADRVVKATQKSGKKLVIGYILRVHPSWIKFIGIAQTMGKPLVMRMNLNQQSKGRMWEVHKNLMKSLSPIVDCAVHYIDVMIQMTEASPVWVSAIGARLTEDIPAGNYNYGQLQIRFDDGSIGWYEAGWGPMISENAFFIKDVFGPKGSVSIMAKNASATGHSDDIDSHSKTESLLVHHADIDQNNQFTKQDEWVDFSDEPDHDELCKREQEYFLKCITENLDMTRHLHDAVYSLKVALACDESVKTGEVIRL